MATKTTRKRASVKSTAPEAPDMANQASDALRNALLRRSVLDAAARLFAERGFGGTNLQDVAAALGMSRPSLYYYFSSKEKLLEALLEEVTFSAERQSSDIAGQADLPADEALRLVIRNHAAWILEHGIEFRVIDRSDNELSPELRERHQQSKRRVLDNVTKIIERGIRSGRFRDLDAKVAAFSVIGMCSWTAWWFKPGGRSTIAQVADEIGEMAAKSLVRSETHRACGDNPLEALRVIKDDVAFLEQLLRPRSEAELPAENK
jgi:AcrR family transcriptional regulator